MPANCRSLATAARRFESFASAAACSGSRWLTSPASRSFGRCDFPVTPDVLIPRPETERLVEICTIMRRAVPGVDVAADRSTWHRQRRGRGDFGERVADRRKSAPRIFRRRRLQIARATRDAISVAERMQFFTGDLFDALAPRSAIRFDLIVTNPPYVRRADIVTLAPEVSRWEPRVALDGGADGLDFYRRIAAAALGLFDRAGRARCWRSAPIWPARLSALLHRRRMLSRDRNVYKITPATTVSLSRAAWRTDLGN